MTTATVLIAALQRDQWFKRLVPAAWRISRLQMPCCSHWALNPPTAALAALSAMWARINERKEAIRASRERMTKAARRTAEAVNLGMIVEKIVPSFPSFAYEAGDCRFNAIGLVDGRILFVTYTMRGAIVRIISARGAEPHEKRKYHEI